MTKLEKSVKSVKSEGQAFKPNLSVEEAQTLRNSGEYEIPNNDPDYFHKLVMARMKASKCLCMQDVVSELKHQNLRGKDGEIWITKVLEIFERRVSGTKKSIVEDMINSIRKKNEWPYSKVLAILEGTESINENDVSAMVVSGKPGSIDEC